MIDEEKEQTAYRQAFDAIQELREVGWFKSGLISLVSRVCDNIPRGDKKD